MTDEIIQELEQASLPTDEDFAYWYRLGIIKTEQKGEEENETDRPDTLHQAAEPYWTLL